MLSSNYSSCILGVLDFLRIFSIFGCIIFALYQLSTCFMKLQYPPITTQTRFVVNDSMTYPILTICRYPPYKHEVLKQYKLEPFDPTNRSLLLNFPWQNRSLSEFWNESTYSFNETVHLYGILGNDNEEKQFTIRSDFRLIHGQCHTIIPLNTTSDIAENSGWYVVLKNDLPVKFARSGWNIYVYDSSQHWTENTKDADGYIENLFLDPGNEVHYKINAKQINSIATSDFQCSNNLAQPYGKCIDYCRMENITTLVGCSAPWMPPSSTFDCTDPQSFNRFIDAYFNFDLKMGNECGCVKPCKKISFNLYSSKAFVSCSPNLAQLSIYYTSKLVNVIEDRHGYDLSRFVSDLGGSLGFILGLSVVGLIESFQSLVRFLINKTEYNESTYKKTVEKK